MDLSWQTALGAFAGGAFGVAIGGLPSFILTGFLTLVGVTLALAGGEYNFLGLITFGPVLGPHITFCGGVAGAAFAKRIGKLENAKDIATPLAGLADPRIHIVGGIFGLIGYVAVAALSDISITANNTDVIALVVGLSNIVSRLTFGTTGPFGRLSETAVERGRWTPGDENVWVQWQQGWVEAALMGGGTGLLAAWLATQSGGIPPDLARTIVPFGYALSAITLIWAAFEKPVPVTHHMTLMGALGAVVFGNILWGVVFGLIGAVAGEVFSRLFLIHGDTFVDPPAWSIALTTTIILIGAQLFM